jgi:hypothetical protein
MIFGTRETEKPVRKTVLAEGKQVKVPAMRTKVIQTNYSKLRRG